MKTQRRHELQTNQLADWLGRQIELIRPFMKTILAVIIGGAAIVWVLFYWAGAERAQSQVAWNEFHLAMSSQDAELLRDVASRYRGTTPGLWSRLAAADVDLSNGISILFRDSELAEKTLQQAKADYLAVIEGAQDPLLERQAKFGLAQTYESLGELKLAREHYQELAGGQTALAQEAALRVKMLDEPGTRALYEALANYDPSREELRSPGGLLDPNQPFDFDSLPDLPDIGVPGQPDASVAPAAAEEPVEESDETAAEPASTQPADESPSETTSVTTPPTDAPADQSSQEQPAPAAEPTQQPPADAPGPSLEPPADPAAPN